MTVPDYRDPRLTEQRNPRTERIDVASTLEIVDLLNGEDATVAGAVRAVRGELARAIDLVVSAFGRGGRLIYIGAGTSGRLGVLDASECPPTFGTPPGMVVGGIAGGAPALGKSREGVDEGGYRHQARPQHAVDGRDDPAGARVRQPHGGPGGTLRQAAGPRRAYRDGVLRCGSRGGAWRDRSRGRPCEARDCDGEAGSGE